MSTPKQESKNRNPALWGIIVLALCCRLYGLTGDMFYDPIIYAQEAYNVVQGTFTLETDSWYAHRLCVFLPVAPVYALLGISSLTSRIWPLALSLLQIGFLLAIGRRLFDFKTALLAGLFIALYPLDIVYSGVLQPDIALSTFLTGAVLFWILGMEGAEKPRKGFLVLSGGFVALAVIARATAPIVFVFFLGYVLWRRPHLQTILWFVLGGVIVTIPLLLAYAVETGDPFYRIAVVLGRFGAAEKSEGTRILFYPSMLWHIRYSLTGLFLPLFVLGTFGAFLKLTPTRGYMLLWALPILLFLQFGSMSVTEYIPIYKRLRFLMPLTVPFALLTASVLLWWLRVLVRRIAPDRSRRTSERITVGLLAAGLFVLAMNSWSIVSAHRERGEQTFDAFQSVVRLIRSEPELPVLFDHWRTCYRFSYYLGFEEGSRFYVGAQDSTRMGCPGSFGDSRFGYLTWYPDPSKIPGSLIVLDDEAMAQVLTADYTSITYMPGEIPKYAYEPPDSWRALGRFGTLRVFRIDPIDEAPKASAAPRVVG